MVFNILMDNTDDHEKNHALLVVSPHENGRLKLAPAYDVLPTNSGQGFQEFSCGSLGHESTLVNAVTECAAFGLLPVQAAQEVTRVIAVVNTWQAHFAKVGVSAADIEHLAAFIDGDGLLAQRREFDPGQYASSKPRSGKGARRSPFQP
jgi:serine/threonine-protein kinase HipA